LDSPEMIRPEHAAPVKRRPKFPAPNESDGSGCYLVATWDRSMGRQRPVQGNLDPLALLAGGIPLKSGLANGAFSGAPPCRIALGLFRLV
jgi:hypothetical protein